MRFNFGAIDRNPVPNLGETQVQDWENFEENLQENLQNNLQNIIHNILNQGIVLTRQGIETQLQQLGYNIQNINLHELEADSIAFEHLTETESVGRAVVLLSRFFRELGLISFDDFQFLQSQEEVSVDDFMPGNYIYFLFTEG